MVGYFKELENLNGQYLDLIDKYHSLNYHDIGPNYIPLDYFLKHKILFDRIKEYDLLYEKNDKQVKLYTDRDNKIKEDDIWGCGFDYDWMFNYDYKYGPLANINGSGLSKYGLEKIYELDYELLVNKEEMDMDYFIQVLDILFESGDVFKITLNHVHNFLISSYKIAKVQKKLTLQDESLFKDALEDLKKYTLEIPKKKFEPVKMYLPNTWYITPYNHLYNTLGKNGHKEANLIYPYYYYIIRDDSVVSPEGYLKKIQKALKDGCIDRITFETYTNLVYDFISIYPEEYYCLSDEDRFRYRAIYKKTYNPRIIKLIIGIESAQAGLYNFFYHLKNNSLDYKSDLEYLKQFDLADILVRCCGFHKISSISDKTITTSLINYEEEFQEYINREWKIDFVKPIIFNEYTKRVEEYPDDFLKIRTILKK